MCVFIFCARTQTNDHTSALIFTQYMYLCFHGNDITCTLDPHTVHPKLLDRCTLIHSFSLSLSLSLSLSSLSLSLSCTDLLSPLIRNKLSTSQRSYKLWAGKTIIKSHNYINNLLLSYLKRVMSWLCVRSECGRL